MENIDAISLSIGKLLEGEKYTLGYFQREYNWEKEHMLELINDLFEEFEQNTASAGDVGKFSSYFLGSIIVSESEQGASLIDGQQRLTSLTLILIWIASTYSHISKEIKPLIYSKKNGVRAYTLHTKDRKKIMDDLWDKREVDTSDSLTSVQNIKANFDTVENCIREYNYDDAEMKAFTEWLKNNVYMAKITISTTDDEYMIFESANDRGLNLSPVDMLKSYLLSNVGEHKERMRLNTVWKDAIDEILNAGESDSVAIKCWLRATLAQSQKDFYDIGSEFHHWMKNKSEKLGLVSHEDFKKLVENQFCFYAKWYIKLKEMARKYTPEHDVVYYNASQYFTLQYTVILSAISEDDDENTILKKINVVATFLDIFIAHHLWNGQTAAIGQRRAKYAMYSIIEKIRGKKLDYIVDYLQDEIKKYNEETETINLKFKALDTPKSKAAIRYFLARFSAWLDAETTYPNNTNFPSYNRGKIYEIEHIMPDMFTDYYKEVINEETGETEFENEADFQNFRNEFGALLLLHSSFNESYGAIPYEKKIDEYLKQNMLLPQTLHEKACEHNPELSEIKTRIRFTGHKKFLKNDIARRNEIYTRMAKIIWEPNRIKQAAED